MTDIVPPHGKVGVVSGGSRGLGRVLVERLLSDGWRVATFSRKPNDFTELTAEKYAKDFYWEPVDMRDMASLRSFTRAVESIFGRIDLLVNNGGELHQELFLTTAPQRMQDVVDTNLLAPMHLSQMCARFMMRDGGGAIVNVSSINAIRGHRGVSAYSAAKAGLEGLSRSLARELGPLNIRVNALTPGFFDSEMTEEVTSLNREKIRTRTPLGRLGTVEEIADAVVFLASPQAGFITGQTLVVDGGITC
jgi:3-oxoacyl-[acyl-carrier protein] reductase